jgi:hypothetical protein
MTMVLSPDKKAAANAKKAAPKPAISSPDIKTA